MAGARILSILLLGLVTNITAHASPILDGWAFNLDGVFTAFNQLGPSGAGDFPAAVNASGYDVGVLNPPAGSPGAGTGLGTLTATFTGAGHHVVALWLDLHIDNGTPVYWDEFGDTLGSPAAGQSWQIDEPGYGALGYTGTIFNNVQNSSPAAGSLLTNTNALPLNGSNSPNDVALALARDFALAAGQTATWTVTVDFVSDPGVLSPRFYLLQSSTDVPGTIAMADNLSIATTAAVPEPATWVLVLGGVLCGLKRRRP